MFELCCNAIGGNKIAFLLICQARQSRALSFFLLHGRAFRHIEIEGKLLDETIFVRGLVGESFQIKRRTVSN